MSSLRSWPAPPSVEPTWAASRYADADQASPPALDDARRRLAKPPADGALVAEAMEARAMAAHAAAWADLATRSLEPNPFMAPGFAVPAALHLARPDRLVFVLVWQGGGVGAARRLMAVCPLVRSRPLIWPVAQVWFHDLAALGAPLLDRDAAEPALLTLLDWVARHRPLQAGLAMTALDRAGPTARLLDDIAARTGRRLRFLDERQRAILRGGHAAPAGLAALSRRRAKELLRQRRRLADLGELRYESVSGASAVEDALELFLRLEARGWKGRARTALLARASTAAFVRDMVGRMAAQGQCRVDTLWLGRDPIAMGILLSGGANAYFWKTAFAEEHAALSPGVQFVADLTRAQQVRGDITATDSCAIPDHPMIDRLWPARLTIVDAVVGLSPAGAAGFDAALRLEQGRRSVRAGLKRLYVRLRSRKRR